jgi:hypothetical protein
VRASHRALNEIILPANHPFWTYHTPPWEWNCRCQVVELTEEDRDEELARDDKRPPESRRVLQGTALKQLDQGSLNRGLSTNVDVRTPKERGGSYQWSARETTLPYDEIRKRWDEPVAAAFEDWAGKQAVGLDNLLDVLQGRAVFRERRMVGGGGIPRQLFVDTAKELATYDSLSIGATPLSAELSPGRKAALAEWEEEHSRDSIEHGLLLDSEGNELGREVGEKGKIAMPKGKPTFGGIFSHSHPARYSFSGEDLDLLYDYRLAEVRATTQQGIFSFSRNPRHGAKEILERMDQISKDVDASIATLDMSAGEKDRLLNHTVWTILAREGFLNYHFTPMRSKITTTEALSATPLERPSWFEREGFAALLEKVLANPEAYGEPTEAEIKVGMRLPKTEGGTLDP